MRTSIWCEIVCDRCADTVAGRYVTGSIPRKSMKDEAIGRGYWFVRGSTFCSRKCLDAYFSEQEPGHDNQ